MRKLALVSCVLIAACTHQGGPTAPSGVIGAAGTQVQATGGANIVEVAFTKWPDASLGGFPFFTGKANDGAVGSFTARVLDRTDFDNGNIIDLLARYVAFADDPARRFVAEIEGKQNNQTLHAVLNGTVTESSGGGLTGARVHVTFDVLRPCPDPNDKPVCFKGILRVLAGSAH